MNSSNLEPSKLVTTAVTKVRLTANTVHMVAARGSLYKHLTMWALLCIKLRT